MAQATTQQIVWLGMRLTVPAEWDIVRHAVSPQNGSLSLVDRRRQRLQLSWRELQRSPDVSRMIQDYKSRDAEQRPNAKVRELPEVNGWRALRRTNDENSLTRALRYEPECKRLIELALPWPLGVEEEIEELVLETFEVDVPAGDAPTDWRAFGLDVSAPVGWRLKSVKAQAGQTKLTFESEGKQAVLRRLSAAELWYNGQPDAWLEKDLSAAPDRIEMFRHRGHQACLGQSLEPTTRFEKILGRARQRRDLVWHCPVDHALYQITTLSPEKDPVEPAAFTIRCG